MAPNIPENKRNRKKVKSRRKQIFDKKIFAERFRTIERVFAWKDKFKRLLLRFEVSLCHKNYCLQHDQSATFLRPVIQAKLNS